MSAPAPLEPAYIITGTDHTKVRRAVDRLRRRVIAEAGSDLNVTIFDAEVDAPTAVLEAASTPGFALGTRLLLVRNGDRWRVKERRGLVEYLADPMPDTCLAIEGDKFAKDDALRKAVAKVGSVLQYDLPKKYEMAKWVRERAGAHHLDLPLPVARHLLDHCGEDPAHVERLEREIEKLALYCRGATATPGDIDAVCCPDDDNRSFDLMDAVGHRDRARAFLLLESLYASGGPRNDANSLLYTLIGHVRLLDQALGLPRDVGRAEAAKLLGVHAYRAGKAMEQCRDWDHRRTATALRALSEAEVGMRGRPPATLESVAGVNHGDRLVLELALGKMLA